ncbi:MAG: GntR family transcriptional regulator [Spirochaetes bacterium]|nr:GntR family transcriptional regulator [Spirochaetota bacterium]
MELVPGAPLFHQLAQALRAEIRSGKRAKGEYLPNEAALEKAYGVSRVTVRRALAELKAEGLIESRRRAGTRVTGKGAASRSRLIGVLTPNMFQAQYASFLHALEGALRPQGLDLIVHNSELSPEVERAGLEAHLARGVEAILHIWDKKSAANLPLLKRIAAAGIPLLVVDHREAGLDADFIVQDHRLGMKLALEYLVARGARKLLHVRAVVGLWGADEREAGFREEARRQGVPTGDLTTLVGDYDGETARASLARHYRPGVPFPTGIVASADMTAQAAHDFFHERGARIPGELHLVAFGTDPGALRSREAIQCIDSMAAVQARAAAARLLERLGGDGARRVVVTPMALAPGGRG